MRVLIIPDIHLKSWMFDCASKIMYEHAPDCAVSLGDLVDDWGHEYHMDMYGETLDKAIWFAKSFPNTLWSYGNHDIAYPWDKYVPGHNDFAQEMVNSKLAELINTLPRKSQLAIVHKIDNVLFSHGGLAFSYVQEYVEKAYWENTDAVVDTLNDLGSDELWRNDSPLWLRPQAYSAKLYQEDNLLQVVGHTPVHWPYREGNLISTDVFSTYRNGRPIGTEEFIILDTNTWSFEKIKAGFE